jgi:hypothetical protein
MKHSFKTTLRSLKSDGRTRSDKRLPVSGFHRGL